MLHSAKDVVGSHSLLRGSMEKIISSPCSRNTFIYAEQLVHFSLLDTELTACVLLLG